MVDRAAMVLLWKGVSSGQRGSDSIEKWQEMETAANEKRAEELEARMRIFPEM